MADVSGVYLPNQDAECVEAGNERRRREYWSLARIINAHFMSNSTHSFDTYMY
jgi:hypothetical protein